SMIQRCKAARHRSPVTFAALTREIAAISGCRSSRCATSRRGTFMYARIDRFTSPADLVGKRVGMYDWVASGSIWYRHFLQFLGVPPESLQWWIGDIDATRAPTHLYTLPEGVHRPTEGRSLSEMLIVSELDAIYSPPRPQHYDPVNGPIIRLFPDIRAIERDYFRQTGCFPPRHLIILRRDVWEQNKWIARSLTDAFIRCNNQFAAAQ